MKKPRTSRRRFLKIAAGAGVAAGTLGLTGRRVARAAPAAQGAAAALGDSQILLEFDSQMRARVWNLQAGAGGQKVALTRWTAPDVLVIGTDSRLVAHEVGVARGAATSEPPYWSFCGSTHADRRDWVQPVRAGFEQQNFMGMSAADYGGGTPIWCAWGYERDCTLQLIEDTLPKVRELGLRWAVIDDGWQTNVGDWKVNPAKYPRGEADMRQLVQKIRSYDLEARLWWAPLAVVPGSDLLHDHTDMLLLDKDGAVQNISWWNAFYLCLAYPPTVDYRVGLVRKFIGEWGYAGLKIDGQHLNAVAPCYNPAHKHARPEESVEKLQDFFQAVYQAATRINPQAVVELCPCGTSYSFFNFRSFNQAPASDPESVLAGPFQGQEYEGPDGPGRGLCRGSRRVERRRRGFRLHGRHRRHCVHEIHLAARSETQGFLLADPRQGNAPRACCR